MDDAVIMSNESVSIINNQFVHFVLCSSFGNSCFTLFMDCRNNMRYFMLVSCSPPQSKIKCKSQLSRSNNYRLSSFLKLHQLRANMVQRHSHCCFFCLHLNFYSIPQHFQVYTTILWIICISYNLYGTDSLGFCL